MRKNNTMNFSEKLAETLKDNPDPDAKVMWHLIQHGSDLAKEHEPDFSFSASREKDAQDIAKELSGMTLKVTIYGPNKENPGFEVVGVKKMKLDLPTMQNLSKKFEEIANSYNGEYLGWGTEIVE